MRQNRVTDPKRGAGNDAHVPLSRDEHTASATPPEHAASSYPVGSTPLPGDGSDNPPVEHNGAHIGDAFLALDGDWHVTYVNADGRFLGRRRDEVLGMSFWDALPLLRESPLRMELERAVRERRAFACEVSLELPSQPPASMLCRFTIRVYPDEETSGSAIYFREIPQEDPTPDSPLEQGLLQRELERRVIQAALAADVGRALTSGEPLRAKLQRCAEALVARLDAAFARIWTLDEGERMLELEASAGLYTHLDGTHGRIPLGAYKIGRIAQDRLPHLTNQVIGDPQVHDQDWARREGMVAFAGYPLIADDHVVGVMALFARHPLDDSALDALASIADEVALAIAQSRAQEQRERLLAEVERTRALFEAVLQQMPAGVIIAEASSGRLVLSNEQVDRILGHEFRPVEGLEQYDRYQGRHADGRPYAPHEYPLARVLMAGEAVRDEEMGYLRGDGTPITVLISAAPVHDPSGQIVAGVVSFSDITERKLADDALRASETALRHEQERLRIALAASETGTFRWDPQTGVFLDFDENLKRLFGFAPDEPVRVTEDFIARVHPDDVAALIPAVNRCREGADFDMEYRVILPDGSIRWLADRAKMERDAEGRPTYLVGACTDITRRKQVEAAVRESEEKFRTLADNIPTLAWMAWPDGHIFWYNRRWYEYTGTTPESQEGWGWQSVHDPDALPHVVARWRASITSGEPFEMVFPLRGADGVFRPFLTRIVPIKDNAGQVVRWFGINTDVSDLRAAEEALRAANRRMDEFLHTATHELKTPLTAVQANLQLVERRLQRLLAATAEGAQATPGEALQTIVQFIARSQQQVRRLTRLVNDLVDAARIQAGKLEMRPAPCDLAEIVWEAVTEQRAVRPGREIELRLAAPQGPEASVPVEADADRIGQVVTNYLTNALKYSSDEAAVEVALRVEGEVARVWVRDAGPGIPAEEQAHVWERGHRVPGIEPTGEGVGLGLGLHISREIIERHGGAVGVESTPGTGSTFWFTLPLARDEQADVHT